MNIILQYIFTKITFILLPNFSEFFIKIFIVILSLFKKNRILLKIIFLGFSAKPENHLFFRRIEPLLNRHLDKANRENDFIYHQKVPTECPLLNSKVSFGLAQPHPFVFPKPTEVNFFFKF